MASHLILPIYKQTHVARAHTMAMSNDAGIPFDLDVLQANMEDQGWTQGVIMHKHLNFLADTVSEPRQRISVRVVQVDDRKGTLFIDRCDLRRCMASSAPAPLSNEIIAMQQLIESGRQSSECHSGCLRYPFNLMEAALNLFANPNQYCFVRILYEIKIGSSLTNNFACIVPFSSASGDVCMQTAWNGCWWESMVESRGGFHMSGGKQFMSVISKETPDPHYATIMSSFCTRACMSWASALISPFLTPARRDRGQSRIKEMLLNYNDLTYVEFSLGLHVPISHMHVFLKKQLPSSLVAHIMTRLQQTGAPDMFKTQSNERVQVFKIDLLMAAIVAQLLEVEAPYRADYNGEDIGTRFDLVSLEDKGPDADLIAGDDCEGMAAIFVSFEHSLELETQAHGAGAGPFSALGGIMCAPEKMKWRVCVARGTCLQASNEQNHTFAVVMHHMTVGTRLHVIETVSSQIVMPPGASSTARAQISHLAPAAAVIDEARAQRLYQHVCVLDEFMVFEFGHMAGEYGIHFGAACFFTYHKHFVVSEVHRESQAFSRFREECRLLQSLGDTEQRILLLITQEAYMHLYSQIKQLNFSLGLRWKSVGKSRPEHGVDLHLSDHALKLFTSGIRRGGRFTGEELSQMNFGCVQRNHFFLDSVSGDYFMPCAQDDLDIPIDCDNFHSLLLYYEFTRLFTLVFFNKLYNENNSRTDQWVEKYFSMHPRSDTNFDASQILALVCFVGENTAQQEPEAPPPTCKLNPGLVQKIAQKVAVLEEISRRMSGLVAHAHGYKGTQTRTCIACVRSCAKGELCMLRILQSNLEHIKPYFCGRLEQDLGALTQNVLAKIQDLHACDDVSASHFRSLYHALRQVIFRMRLYLLQHQAKGVSRQRAVL